MKYTLYLQKSAIQDLREAYDWYEEQKPGLGAQFLAETDIMFTQIELSPLIFAKIYKQKRRAVIRRFPYNIIYSVEGS